MNGAKMKKWQESFYALINANIDSPETGYFIPKDEGRRLVIPDIHGCLHSFNKLLQKINFNKHDQLFVIGDMVNRGLYSALVVDLIIDYIKRGYRIYPLRGNHEQILLDTEKKSPGHLYEFANKQDALHLLDEKGRLKSKYRRFFESLPYYYETDTAWLVHAGFDFERKKPFENLRDMMWIREFGYDEEKAKGKTIYHGHNPVELSVIIRNIEQERKIIPLDNGCVMPEKGKEFGNLLCFNMDTHLLHVQANVDRKKVTG